MVEDSFPAEDSQEADREWEEAGTKYMIRKAHPQWATSFSYAPHFTVTTRNSIQTDQSTD